MGSDPRRTTRRILVLLVAVAVIVVTGVVLLRPRSGGTRDEVSNKMAREAVLDVLMVIDAVDAAKGSMRVKVSLQLAEGGLPPEGVTVVTSIGAIPLLRVEPTKFPPEASGDVSFDSGEVSAYPFDRYHVTMGFAVVRGTDVQIDRDPTPDQYLPFGVRIVNAAAGFEATAALGGSELSGGLDTKIVGVDVGMTRQRAQVGWALAMIAGYWILALAVLGVVLATVLRAREWESRHLAWLTAMIFAFAAFRNTAPGSPPVGVWFDWASYFPSTVLVAACLLLLVSFFLVGLDRRAPGAAPPGGAPATPSDVQPPDDRESQASPASNS